MSGQFNEEVGSNTEMEGNRIERVEQKHVSCNTIGDIMLMGDDDGQKKVLSLEYSMIKYVQEEKGE